MQQQQQQQKQQQPPAIPLVPVINPAGTLGADCINMGQPFVGDPTKEQLMAFFATHFTLLARRCFHSSEWEFANTAQSATTHTTDACATIEPCAPLPPTVEHVLSCRTHLAHMSLV